MVAVAYQCCICGDNIDEDAHKLDPCYLQISTNMGGDDEEKLEQGFFCHYECFKGIMAYDGHLNLEGQDGSVAYNYLQSEKYEEAVELFEKVLPTVSTDEKEYGQFLLVGLIQCHKKLKDVAKQKEYLRRGLDLCDQGVESAEIYYEAAASAYADGDFQKSKDYIEKYKNTYEVEIPDDAEDRSEYESKYFDAMLAINLGLKEESTVRTSCADWIEQRMPFFEPLREDFWGTCNQIADCLQHLKEFDLLFRIAESEYMRKVSPSLEFGLKALIERARGNNSKAYQEFVKYKQIYQLQVEGYGESFEEEWARMKSDSHEVQDFEIPDNDPPLAVLVDEYIHRYGKLINEEG